MRHRVSCPDFVGRAAELDLLDATYRRSTGRQAATVLLGGDAGIGKSRLVAEFCRRVREGDARIATGACVPIAGGGLPYGPVVGILRDVADQLGEPAAADVLTPVSGLGLDVPGLGGPAGVYSALPRVGDALAKTRLFESILTSVVRLAERDPLVLVLEDLHWADAASAEVVSFLSRNLAEARVMVIGTYRSDELGRDHPLRHWLSELGRHPRVTPVRLDGLGRDEMAAMIGGILGHQPDRALVDAVSRRSQGNPFYAEELTAARSHPSLSPELRGVITDRVDRLSREAKQLLGAAAAAGATADHDLLVAVSGLDLDPLEAALAEVVAKQLLVVDDASQEGYRFRHALVREALYADLLPGERRRLHQNIATAFTADPSLCLGEPDRRVAELAAHWWAAGAWAEALNVATAAAEAAIALWAFPDALVHLEHALSALDQVSASAAPDGITRLGLLEKASDVAYLAGEGERSVELARAAVDCADAGGDTAAAARSYALLGRNAWAIGDSDAAFHAYRQAAAAVPADPPSATLARVLAEEARGLMLMSRMREAEVRCRHALPVALDVGARAEEGHLRYTLGCCRAILGHDEEGIGLVREALAIAEELGSPDDLNRAFMGLSGLLLVSGRLEEAAALAFDSAAVGEELWGVRLNGATGNSVEALIRLGRLDEAEALLDQAGDRGVGSCVSQPGLLAALIAIRRGRSDEAARHLARAEHLSARLADVQTRGMFHTISAEFALQQSRPEDAYEEAERALALAAGTDEVTAQLEMCALGVRALADRLTSARAHGRRIDVDKIRLLAVGLVQETERLVAVPSEHGGSSPPRAAALAVMCAAERSRLDDADPDLWQEAGHRWDAAGEPHPAAYCRWREAEARLEQRAGRSRAGDCLQQAWQTSVDLDALPLREQIEHLARRARIPLRQEAPTPATNNSTVAADLGLTPREVEVLGQLAAGQTDREIAESLFISKKTVSVHVSNLLRKLDASNRVEAGRVGQAHQLG